MKKFDWPITKATYKCMEILDMNKLAPLAENCPGLATFDWTNYLYCSQWRIQKVIDFLWWKFRGKPLPRTGAGPKILDFGSWLGNFSLALYLSGYTNLLSAERWLSYSPALDTQKKLLADWSIDCLDSLMISERPQGPVFDVILFMSAIEHISGSPRLLLKTFYEALQPGGLLIIDTPNLAYIANRRALNRGRSPYVPIAEQFFTAARFEGHVREYTSAELQWMLEQTGFEVIHTEFFNYSMFGVEHPYLMNALSLIPMWMDPTKRELIFMVGRKHVTSF